MAARIGKSVLFGELPRGQEAVGLVGHDPTLHDAIRGNIYEMRIFLSGEPVAVFRS
jgi:hypothetical protein